MDLDETFDPDGAPTEGRPGASSVEGPSADMDVDATDSERSMMALRLPFFKRLMSCWTAAARIPFSKTLVPTTVAGVGVMLPSSYTFALEMEVMTSMDSTLGLCACC